MEIAAEQVSQLVNFGICQSSTFKTMLFNTSLAPIPKRLINQGIQVP